eukprot:2202165-Prymnesium_polylepis.1
MLRPLRASLRNRDRLARAGYVFACPLTSRTRCTRRRRSVTESLSAAGHLSRVDRQHQLLGDREVAGEPPEGQLDAAAARALALGREGEPRLGLREALFCAFCAVALLRL